MPHRLLLPLLLLCPLASAADAPQKDATSFTRQSNQQWLQRLPFDDRAELFGQHSIKREALSVRQRMGEVLTRLSDRQFHGFETLFSAEEGRLGVVVTFLSILELAKEQLLEIVQEAPLAPIYIKSLADADGAAPPTTFSSEFDDDVPEPAQS